MKDFGDSFLEKHRPIVSIIIVCLLIAFAVGYYFYPPLLPCGITLGFIAVLWFCMPLFKDK